jgi:L-amino acid N-acyltransferase YncA
VNAQQRIVESSPPAELLRDEPDVHLALEGESGARCSIWWRDTPEHEAQRVGAIGHFSAADAESGAALLRGACERLAARGCRVAVGPMDGNTWRRYRVVVERSDEPPFLLEPDTPPHWGECFARAGFAPLATYRSSVQDDLGQRDDRVQAVARRAAAAGIRIRSLDCNHVERDLCGMHALALSAFSASFLFSPISQAAFLAQYSRLLPHVNPQLVLIAEQRGEVVGFAFGLPDVLGRVILKTVAVRPGLAYMGLGHALADHGAGVAAGLGYRRAVHALMHEANSSSSWSARYGRVFRRYALLGRSL